ncbi:MAG: hypothetical protein LC722_05465 [Actinobacteria bacterium]|nr:hypothetical protein [Actinomycetota bacterium]
MAATVGSGGKTSARDWGVGAVLTTLFVAAAAAGIWLWYRADPPLPPSWGWIRIPLTTGLLGAGLWVRGAFRARH